MLLRHLRFEIRELEFDPTLFSGRKIVKKLIDRREIIVVWELSLTGAHQHRVVCW